MSVPPQDMHAIEFGTNHDFDSVFITPQGVHYVQGSRRENVAQVIEQGLGPLAQLVWIPRPHDAVPVSTIGQPFVGALVLSNISQVTLPLLSNRALSNPLPMLPGHWTGRCGLHDRSRGCRLPPPRVLD